MSGPTAIVAEDEATLRHQLVEQLGQLWPELQIVGEAADGVQALRLLESPSAFENEVLGAFPYATNEVILHTDEHLLPWYVAAGAGGRHGTALRLHDSLTFGSLGMDAYVFGPAAAQLRAALPRHAAIAA